MVKRVDAGAVIARLSKPFGGFRHGNPEAPRNLKLAMSATAVTIDLGVPYAPASPDIAHECFDGDVVVVDLENGKYYSFTQSGSAIWLALTEATTPADLVEHGAFGDSVPEFVLRLCEYRLIAARPDIAPAPLSAACAERLRNSVEAPDVTVFDDMADLFVADPIHDVDEPSGWPVVKQD